MLQRPDFYLFGAVTRAAEAGDLLGDLQDALGPPPCPPDPAPDEGATR